MRILKPSTFQVINTMVQTPCLLLCKYGSPAEPAPRTGSKLIPYLRMVQSSLLIKSYTIISARTYAQLAELGTATTNAMDQNFVPIAQVMIMQLSPAKIHHIATIAKTLTMPPTQMFVLPTGNASKRNFLPENNLLPAAPLMPGTKSQRFLA